jgi:pyruvate ferredoxin oxidoreductase gamma subunit
MQQIRIHGRGGQGVVTAAEILAIAAFIDGQYSQAFPSFGVERTGAPIEAYVRIDEKPIRIREHIHTPDIIIIQDATLLDTVNVASGCTPKTFAIINTTKDKNGIKLDIPAENITTVDATKIALEELGKNLANTVILGAFAKVSGLFKLDSLKKAIKQKFADKNQEIINKNIKAIERAYNL